MATHQNHAPTTVDDPTFTYVSMFSLHTNHFAVKCEQLVNSDTSVINGVNSNTIATLVSRSMCRSVMGG